MKFEDAVLEIKRRIDIATVVGRYIRLRKTGNSWTGLCPFHNEKTPSFNVRSDRGTFKCFGCGASGDVFSFIEQKTGQLFADIVRKLAGDIGITIDAPRNLQKSNVLENQKNLSHALLCAHEYFRNGLKSAEENGALSYLTKERGLSLDEVAAHELGFGGFDDTRLVRFLETRKVKIDDAIAAGLLRKGEHSLFGFFAKRITIPIKDHRGRIVAFAGRSFLESDKDRPKYINSPSTLVYEKSKVLYGLFESLPLLKKGLPAVLVEGYFDVIAIRKLGVPAVAPCGTSLTEEHVHMLARYTKSVLLCFDKDIAGRTAQKKALLLLLQNGFHVKAVTLSGKDPDAVIRAGDAKKVEKSLIEAQDAVELLCKEVSQMSIFGMKERLVALKALIPFLAASPSQLANRQYVKLASRILGEEERVLLREISQIAPNKEKKAEERMVTVLGKKRERTKWTRHEKLLARALLSTPKIALKIDSSLRHSLNFELSDFIDRLSQMLTQEPAQDPHSLLYQIPISRESEWVDLFLEHARHPNLLSFEDSERILEELKTKDERTQMLEELSLEHTELLRAQESGDLKKMHDVLAQQRQKLKSQKKPQKNVDLPPNTPPKEKDVQEIDHKNDFDDFEELRWT